VKVLKTLVGLGASVESQASNGERPIHWAANKGKDEAVRCLVHLGACVDCASGDGNRRVGFGLRERGVNGLKKLRSARKRDPINLPTRRIPSCRSRVS
jgi:hypothetical protein